MTIPHLIHHIWPAHDPIPYTFRANIQTFQDKHPTWAHILWTPNPISKLSLRNQSLYDHALTHAPDDWIRWRADIARLEIIYQYGGVYSDMDVECLKPLDPLMDVVSCWVPESPNALGHATQALIAAEAKHPFLSHLLNELPISAERHSNSRINHRVGSRFVDREYQGRQDVRMLNWDLFAAQSITARDRGQQATPRGFVNHQYFNTDRHRNSAPQVAAFKAAAPLLDEAAPNWFLTSGMVLGHIREGRILPWDMDVDVGIWPEDVNKVRAIFQDAGWQFKRDTDNQMWPVHNKTKIDIHTHHREGSTVYKIHGPNQDIRMSHPAHLFEDMQPTIFYLQETRIPNPPEEYLAHMYGDDWLVVKKDWHWKNDPKNVTLL